MLPMNGFQLYLETYSVIFSACSCLCTFLIFALFFFFFCLCLNSCVISCWVMASSRSVGMSTAVLMDFDRQISKLWKKQYDLLRLSLT